MSDNAVDGVIKYRNVRQVRDITEPAGWTALNDARTALFDLGLIGVDAQGVGYGNVSVRVVGHQFVVSGSATGSVRVLSLQQYGWVTAFSERDNTVWSHGRLDASSESMTHGAIYAANAQVRCVIHVHSRPLFDALLSGNGLRTGSNIAYGTPEMARAVTELVVRQRELPAIFVMAGHDEGVVAYGADVASVQALLLDKFQRSMHS